MVEDIVEELPPSFTGAPVGVPVRWKLLGALPLINVITGVVVSGLSTNGDASLHDLGLDVVVAVLVAFTISLELTVLVTRSVLQPVDRLLEATEAVKAGDLDARVPITSGDELGQLAGSFNEMMEGLSEREALREAFGAYVDPDVAERVLEEGELIEGQEREVTVLILDVCDFTEFAERSSARETVAFLNDLFGIAVPCVTEHGGHANKFLGDGLLAVFGAPERLRRPRRPRRGRRPEIVADSSAEHFGEEVRFGIGINSGPVVVGSVGGGGRLEFAVIGDPVNVAARVEHLTRETGDIDPDHRGDPLPTLGARASRSSRPRRICAERSVGTCADLRHSHPYGRKFETGCKKPLKLGHRRCRRDTRGPLPPPALRDAGVRCPRTRGLCGLLRDRCRAARRDRGPDRQRRGQEGQGGR